MSKSLVVLPALLLGLAATPAAAERPVAPHELDSFIGTTLEGQAMADLGIVAAADTEFGSVAVVGRHGELATIHHSALMRVGGQLHAPTISVGEFAYASYSGMGNAPMVAPRIFIEELPFE